jgi:hypothetical protein
MLALIHNNTIGNNCQLVMTKMNKVHPNSSALLRCANTFLVQNEWNATSKFLPELALKRAEFHQRG